MGEDVEISELKQLGQIGHKITDLFLEHKIAFRDAMRSMVLLLLCAQSAKIADVRGIYMEMRRLFREDKRRAQN